MNDLQVFSKDIIPVYVTDEGEKVVIGRELHERLKIKTDYKDWFPRMCEYGFSEPEDYAVFDEEVDAQKRAHTYSQKNHILKFNMAKHIATIQRTPIGKAIRNKLIALEEKVSSGILSDNEKLRIQEKRAEAMLLNAQTRRYKAIIESVKDKNLSPIAAEVFGLAALEQVTGKPVNYRPECERTYSATEIGEMFGVSSQRIGKMANAKGLKTDEYGITVMDKSRYSVKEVSAFRYNQRAVDRIKELL